MTTISKGKQRIWKENGLNFAEFVRHEYKENNGIFSAGYVVGDNKPKCDIMFLRLEKDGKKPVTFIMTPGEMQTIGWVASGVILDFVHHITKQEKDEDSSV